MPQVQSKVSSPETSTVLLSTRYVNTGSPDIHQGCPTCKSPLNLHQPDENSPSLLLGTCDNCSQWYFLVAPDDAGMGVIVVELPSEATVRELFKSDQLMS